MKSVIFTLSLLSATHALAATPSEARKALNAIPDTTIEQDLKSALQNIRETGQWGTDKVIDYVFCPKGADLPCSRYFLYEAYNGSQENSEEREKFLVALDYSVSQAKGEPAKIEAGWDWHVNEETFDPYTSAAVAKLALAALEKDYSEDAPLKSKHAYHPFQIKVMLVANTSESVGQGEEQRWDGSSNFLVHFSESNDTRVVAYVTGYTYLVRIKEVADQIKKSDVRRLLQIDKLL